MSSSVFSFFFCIAFFKSAAFLSSLFGVSKTEAFLIVGISIGNVSSTISSSTTSISSVTGSSGSSKGKDSNKLTFLILSVVN